MLARARLAWGFVVHHFFRFNFIWLLGLALLFRPVEIRWSVFVIFWRSARLSLDSCLRFGLAQVSPTSLRLLAQTNASFCLGLANVGLLLLSFKLFVSNLVSGSYSSLVSSGYSVNSRRLPCLWLLNWLWRCLLRSNFLICFRLLFCDPFGDMLPGVSYPGPWPPPFRWLLSLLRILGHILFLLGRLLDITFFLVIHFFIVLVFFLLSARWD